MRLQGTDEYHMASVLGYRVEDFLTLVRVAGLEDGRGIIAASFGTVLEFEVEIDPCNIKGRPRENWILFTAAIDMSAGRKKRRDSAGGAGDAAAVEKQTAAHPYSGAADVLLYEYYKKLRKHNIVRDPRVTRKVIKEFEQLLQKQQQQQRHRHKRYGHYRQRHRQHRHLHHRNRHKQDSFRHNHRVQERQARHRLQRHRCR
jgi:hypothetical protein